MLWAFHFSPVVPLFKGVYCHGFMIYVGIGFVNGGMILGEIGDITRFSNPSNLLAFTGLDVAHNVVKNNKTFKDYYDKKWAEDKSIDSKSLKHKKVASKNKTYNVFNYTFI